MGNTDDEVLMMEYADIYVNRIRELCKQRGITINKLAIAFNMTLSEFLDFNELNEYSFEDRDDE